MSEPATRQHSAPGINMTVSGLELRAGQDRKGKRLCQDLQLHLQAGQNWAVLGPNGSGKSTLLHTLAGLIAPAAGQIMLNEQPLQHYTAREKARLVGMVAQDSDDRFPVTVMDAVLAGRYAHHPHAWYRDNDSDHDLARAALAALDLQELCTRPLDQLSGGERRRVDIATLLTQDPPLCLLDEPTNHLDLKHQHDTLALLAARSQAGGRLNVFVLHEINLALRYCDQALLMFADGTTMAGAASELINCDTLGRLFELRFRLIDSPSGPLYLPE